MGKKTINWKTKGMNRDLSVSAFNPEFAFENINLRLATNDSNTMMSWVNEKGTAEIKLTIDTTPWKSDENEEGNAERYVNTIEGTVIGTAVLNHKLILFTHDGDSTIDRIYVLEYSDKSEPSMIGKILYTGNLNLSLTNPIETLVDYESDYIEKVYWTDNRNQPRLINICASKSKLAKWNNQVISNKESYSEDHFFDFVPTFKAPSKVTITQNTSSSGVFAPGVIQYAITYINRYGQQTNIAYISPLYYLSHTNRGASPEEEITSSFKIEIYGLDDSYDYVRLYSIQRSSLNLDPVVKLINSFSLSGESPVQSSEAKGTSASEDTTPDITFIDNNTIGSTVDPTELLYIGGKDIKVLTMTEKDNTLFLGNITEKNTSVSDIQNYFDNNPTKVTFDYGDLKKFTFDAVTGFYSNTNTLKWNNQKITTFKGGDIYRFGFQLQKEDGEWLEPIFLGDFKNDYYPKTIVYNSTPTISLPYATGTIKLNDIEGIDLTLYKKIRPVIVYPTIGDRNVVCQGVLNPTVFNSLDRIDKSPYAQASWYFRPYTSDINISNDVNNTIFITKSSILNDPDISFDPNFSETKIKQVYIIGVKVTCASSIDLKQAIKNSNGFIIYRKSYTKKDGTVLYYQDYYHTFDGYIFLEEFYSDNYAKVALLSTIEWSEESIESLEDDVICKSSYVGFEYYGMGKTLDGTKTKFNFLNTLAISPYYEFWNGESYSYIFKFYIREKTNKNQGYYYTAGFESCSENSTTTITGNDIPFGHYEKLVSSDTTPELGAMSSYRKRVEIQTAAKLYIFPFCSFDSNKATTNSEFFVDQSIITLNSPDLEFNTEVQSCGTDNLKLRIIGAIPITSSASFHNITTKSSTFHTNYNYNPGTDPIPEDYGIGDLRLNILNTNISARAKRLVSEYLWNDATFVDPSKYEDHRLSSEDSLMTLSYLTNFLVYPWHRNGSLSNDYRGNDEACSVLSTKKESNLLYSLYTEYLSSADDYKLFESIEAQIHLNENNSGIVNYRLNKQKSTSSQINYYPNIDKALYNNKEYVVYPEITGNIKVITPVSMKYKSNTHAIIALKPSTDTDNIPILPYCNRGTVDVGLYTNDISYGNHVAGTTFWGDTNMLFNQDCIGIDKLESTVFDFLWLGELYKEVENPFGGTTKSAISACKWQVAGEEKDFTGSDTLNWTVGDTFYQRYDCLKTYAYSSEDTNQLIEILSFMCESHVNIDGRYDKNRGLLDNTEMSPNIFNVINPVYSQQDNYFTYRILDDENVDLTHYPNQVYYSKTKESGADVDLWTNITLASMLELDGDRGKLNSLRRFNNSIFAFQDNGISQILYNDNVQIAASFNTPIELANSNKVQGKRYISNIVGCSNKWSIAQTPSGIYFISNNDRNVYFFNGQLNNISISKGFDVWFKQHVISESSSSENTWNPVDFNDFVAYYDRFNEDVLFINKDLALAFSEKFECFTSFYDYGSSPYFENLDSTGIWIKENKLWKHQAGSYCNFFGTNKPFSITLIGNKEPQLDKTFTTIEFRASVEGEGTYTENTDKFVPTLPFNSLEAWNEYQHGITSLNLRNSSSSLIKSSLNRKFRIWRCDIPRDNAALSLDFEGIKRFKVRPLDRMRNPWVYLKLEKEAASEGSSLNKTEIHDIVASYFG